MGMLLSLPLSFLGLSCFRSWIALLTSTSPLGGFAEPLHDCILTVSLLALAFFARKIVPLCERRWAYAVCAVAALMASLLVIASAAGARPLAIEYAAMAFAAVASAFFILFWCELYSCLSIVKTAMSLALALLATEALKFLLEGFVPAYRLGALLVLPVLTLLLLARAYAHVPADSRPRVTSGKTHIPWKIIGLFAIYDFAQGVCLGIEGSQAGLYSGMAAVVVAALLLTAIVFFSERFDLSFIYRTPVVLLISALLFLPFLGDGSSNVVALSLSLGLRFFEITIFLLICDISKNFALPAVLLFGIEEAVIIFRSAGVGVGSRLDGLAALGVSPSIVIAVGIALVIAATLLLFNDRELSSQWKVSLFGPGKIQQGKEHRELVEAACARVAEDYGLTAREREILLLLSDGKTTKQIGERLCIAKGTVKAHTEHIYAKTGINSRKQLMDLLNVD